VSNDVLFRKCRGVAIAFRQIESDGEYRKWLEEIVSMD